MLSPDVVKDSMIQVLQLCSTVLSIKSLPVRWKHSQARLTRTTTLVQRIQRVRVRRVGTAAPWISNHACAALGFQGGKFKRQHALAPSMRITAWVHVIKI